MDGIPIPRYDGSLAQLRADQRQCQQLLASTAPGSDEYGRLRSQLANLARTIKAAEDRLRGGGQPTLL